MSYVCMNHYIKCGTGTKTHTSQTEDSGPVFPPQINLPLTSMGEQFAVFSCCHKCQQWSKGSRDGRTVCAVVALMVLLSVERLSLPVDHVVGHFTVGVDWRLPRDVQFTEMSCFHDDVAGRRRC